MLLEPTESCLSHSTLITIEDPLFVVFLSWLARRFTKSKSISALFNHEVPNPHCAQMWCLDTLEELYFYRDQMIGWWGRGASVSLYVIIHLSLKYIMTFTNNIAIPAVLWLLFTWYIFLHPFTFNICVSLN